MRSVRHRLFAVVVPAVLVLVVGCGSSDEDPKDAGSSVEDGSSAPKDPAAEVPEDLCNLITAAELSEALSLTVTTEVGPSGDCEFDEEDVRGLSGGVGVIDEADTNGGFDGYVSGVSGTMKDARRTDVSGLGDAAAVFTGLPAMGSSENLMAGGVVDRGTFLLTVTMVQSKGMSAEALTAAAENVLRLLQSKTS